MTSAVYRGCRSATQSVVRKKKKIYIYIYIIKRAASRENLFSGFPTRSDISGCVARLEISGLERREIVLSIVLKTKR